MAYEQSGCIKPSFDDQDFSSVRVSTLRGDQKILFDIYLHLNGKKVLYIRKGDSFEGLRLNRLKDKKLKRLYIKRDHESLYRDYLTQNMEIAYSASSAKSIEDRSEIVTGLQESNSEQVMENPSDKLAYYIAYKGSEQYVKFLFGEERALENMLRSKNVDGSIAHHGVTVGALAMAVAGRLGYSEKQIALVTLGSLIHDIGHLESGLDVARPISHFSDKEMSTYVGHPEAGAKMADGLDHFDKEVITIILQHEEKSNGSGFPLGLKESATDPLALVVSSANALDRMSSFEGLSREDAAQKLLLYDVGTHPLKHIQILQSVIKRMKI